MKRIVGSCVVSLVAWMFVACCMVPVTYEGKIGQDAQEAVLVHDGDREELVLRINYRIKGDKMPDNFVWVITTPKEPDAYALADAALFEDMFNLSERLLKPVLRSNSVKLMTDQAPTEGVELGKHVTVGPYDIQPVRGVGPKALEGLNKWLDEHGFPTEAPDHMTYFVKNNFTFLCVRVIPSAGKNEVTSNGLLPPLHLSFETPSPYYPLRFSSRQGVFDVNLHILTREKLDYKGSKATLAKLNWSNQGYKQNVALKEKDMPDTLKKVFSNSAWKKDIGKWRYNNILCTQVNKGDTIAKWKEDITFAVK